MINRFLILAMSLLVSSFAIATNTNNGNYIAISAANSMNQLQTVGAYLEWVEAFVPAKQAKSIKALFESWNIKNTDQFPQYSVNGNRMYHGKDYIQFGTNSVVINGHLFKLSNKPLDQVMKEICTKIECFKKSRNVSFLEALFINEAQAIAPLALFGIGAAVGGLATWLFSGSAKASESSNRSGVYDQFLSNTLQIGTQFIAQELLGIGNNGYYECQNGKVYAVGTNGGVLNMFGRKGGRLSVPSHLLNSSQTCQQNAYAINESVRINTYNGRITPPSGAVKIDNNNGAPAGAVKISY